MIYVIEVRTRRGKWAVTGNVFDSFAAARDRLGWLEARDDEINRAAVARRIVKFARVGNVKR